MPEYWIVDVDAREVERWRPGDDAPEVVTGSLTWQPSVGGPSYQLDLGQFFQELSTR